MIEVERPRILLVDDDPVFLCTLERSLKERGIKVDAVATPKEAEVKVQEKHFNVVLLDLNLAGESGLHCLDRLLVLKPALRIVMLTGYASIATAVEAIKLGADNYLCKPIRPSEVISLLDNEELQDQEQNLDELNSPAPMSVSRLEWEHLQRVLMDNNGNISATARALGMHRRTLQRKLQKRPVKK